MRTVSDRFRAAMFAQATDEIAVLLLTITHPDLAETWHLSSDTADVLDPADPTMRGTISRGQAFNFLPMTVQLPEEGDDAAAAVQIVIDNVTQEIATLLRSTISPATVTVEIVLASTPDLVEMSFPYFELTSADVDADTVTLSLTVDAMTSEPFPCDNFTPSSFGGLWATT